MTAVSFSIDIPDAKLQQLQAKLKLATLPDELDDAGWDYGAPLSDIKRLVNHWKSGYSWRDAEADLNAKFPQFTTDIDVEGFGSLNIHFVHKKSERVDAIPLLFLHGCECSIVLYFDARSSSAYNRAWMLPRGVQDTPAVDCTCIRA